MGYSQVSAKIINYFGSSLYVSTTRQCNISCEYCHIPSEQRSTYSEDPKKLLSTINDMVEKFDAEGVLYSRIVLHGAECTTLPPDTLAEICNKLMDACYMVSLQTNMVNFSDSSYIDTFFSKILFPKRLGFSTTVDGHKKIHDLSRDNSYDSVMAGVKNIRARGYDVFSLVTINKHTIENLDLFLEWFNENRRMFSDLKFRLVEGPLALNNIEIKKYIDFIYKNKLVEYMQSARTGDTSVVGNKCQILEVDSNGDMYACNQAQEKLGSFDNIFESSILEIIEKRKSYFMSDKFLLHNDCKTCSSLEYCNGGCPIYRSDKNKALDCSIKKSMTSLKIDRVEDTRQKMTHEKMKSMLSIIIRDAMIKRSGFSKIDSKTMEQIKFTAIGLSDKIINECFCIDCICDCICDCVCDWSGVTNIVNNITDVVVDAVVDIAQAPISLALDTVGGTLNIVGINSDFVWDAKHVWKAPGDAIRDFSKATLHDPKSLYTDSKGNFSLMKTVSLAVAIVFAAPTGGGSLAAWLIVNSGAINATTQSMAEAGWITDEQAFWIAVIGNIAVTYYGYSGADFGQGYQNNLGRLYEALTYFGVSAETAAFIINGLNDTIMFMQSMSYTMQIGTTAYEIYSAYRNFIEMEAQWKSMQASFEAWLKKMQEKQATEDSFISGFVNGDAMKYYPGQPMFGAVNAGREYFTSMEGQEPGIVMVGGKLISSDITVARITFDEPSYDWAGNSGYMNTLFDFPKFWRSSIGQ